MCEATPTNRVVTLESKVGTLEAVKEAMQKRLDHDASLTEVWCNKVATLEAQVKKLQERLDERSEAGTEVVDEVYDRLEKLEDADLVYRSRIDKLETRLEALENAHDEAVSKGERVSVDIWNRLEALGDATAGLREEKKLKAKIEFLQNRITQDTKQLNSVAGQLRERGHAPRDDAKTPKDVYGRVWS